MDLRLLPSETRPGRFLTLLGALLLAHAAPFARLVQKPDQLNTPATYVGGYATLIPVSFLALRCVLRVWRRTAALRGPEAAALRGGAPWRRARHTARRQTVRLGTCLLAAWLALIAVATVALAAHTVSRHLHGVDVGGLIGDILKLPLGLLLLGPLCLFFYSFVWVPSALVVFAVLGLVQRPDAAAVSG